jgi:hypothetical protein
MAELEHADLADRETEIVKSRLQRIASIVADSYPQVCADITQRLLDEIPELQGDELLVGLLRASVDENVSAMLHLIGLPISLRNLTAPTAASEYARRLAQRGVNLIALVRSYRIGHARFLDWCVRELDPRKEDPDLVQAITGRMLELSFGYIDRVSEQVVGSYQVERDRWLLTQTAVRASRVHRLLAGQDIDLDATESALGYRLRQHHVAVIGWVPEPTQAGAGLIRLDRLGQSLAADLGCAGRPLFLPYDEAIAWFWLPFGARPTVDWDSIDQLVRAGDPTIQVAVGELEQGVAGFRASHYQASTARNVAVAGRPAHRVTLAERVGPIALMCADLDATRVWVQKTLGPLAGDERNHRALRETLRVFLESGGSYTTAAETLNLHRNTVQYRLNRAKELLPVTITERRSDLELALRACEQLGSVLLREETPPQ